MAKMKMVRKGRLVYMYELINSQWKLVKVTCALLMFLGISGCAFASSAIISEHKAVLCIIGEEEGNYEGMKLVASTIRNRHSLKGCNGLHSKRVVNHLYSQASYNKAVKAWEYSKTHNYGCTYWFSDQDLDTFRVQQLIWKEHLRLYKRIGNYLGNSFFYKST